MWPRIVQVSVDSEIPTYHLRFSNHAQHTSLFGCAASTDISGSYHRGHRCRSMQPTAPPLFLVVAWMHRKATASPPSPQLKLPLSSSIWLARSTVSSRIMAALHLGRHESPNPSSGGRHGCARQCWFVIRNGWGTTSENSIHEPYLCY